MERASLLDCSLRSVPVSPCVLTCVSSPAAQVAFAKCHSRARHFAGVLAFPYNFHGAACTWSESAV